MGFRTKRVRRRPAALPAGGPYRDASAYPLEARRDELHVFVKRGVHPTLFVVSVAAVVASVVFAPTWVIMGVGATAVWLIALGALGDRRIRLTDDRVELGGWAPGLRPTLRGTITAVRVRTTFMRRKGDDVARPTRHDVAVQTTRGERTIASFEHPADAHALAAVIDEHFALVPPAEPLGAPDLDDPPAR